MDIENSTNGTLDKLITFYSEKYEISYNVEAAGITVPVMAQMHHRQPRAIFGFSINREGPEASEYIFFLREECFGMEELARVKELIGYAEKEYVTISEDHAFSFLSVVILADKTEKAATDALKKYRVSGNYGRQGMVIARVAVFAGDGAFCSRDGVDLKKMLQKVIA